MNTVDELTELAAMLEKKAKLADAKVALHRHNLREDDAMKELANAEYCRRKAKAVMAAVAKLGIPPRLRVKPSEDSHGFAKFWAAYPRKLAKADARLAWGKMGCEAFTEKILAALSNAKTSHDWRKEGGSFIPFPATWLNREGWEDDFTKPALPAMGGIPAQDPPGWKEWLTAERISYTAYRFAPDFQREKFNQSRK